MPAESLMHRSEGYAPCSKGQPMRYTVYLLPLLLFLLYAHLSLDTVHEELQRLRHQHHTGDTLCTQQPEQRIGNQRTRVKDTGASMKLGDFDGHLEHVTQWQYGQRAVFLRNFNHLERRHRIARNVPMAEHHAFGLTGRSRRKDQLGQVIARYLR